MLTTSAILLRRLIYGETSYILTWFTAEHGRLKTMVKGARKPKSKFQGQFDLFYLCEIQYSPSRRGEIHSLTESRLHHPFLGLRRDLLTLKTAHYFGELIEHLTESNTPLPEDYALLEKALRYLETHPPTQAVLHRFEKRLLSLHGLALNQAHDFERVWHLHHHRVPPSRRDLFARLAVT